MGLATGLLCLLIGGVASGQSVDISVSSTPITLEPGDEVAMRGVIARALGGATMPESLEDYWRS